MLTVLLAPSGASASSPAQTLGVYRGAGDPAAVAAYEERIGHPVSYAHDFIDGSSWSSIANPSWSLSIWPASAYRSRMVYSVPMLPDSSGSLATGATGAYDSHWQTLARNLVASGQESAVLRIGWEFNGSWFRWSIATPGGAADYAAYWRKIVTAMRSVPGANFRFDWAPNSGSSWVNGQQLNPEAAYPGDAYVDYIGLDQYDNGWGTNYEDDAARWESNMTQSYGMRWHRDFAAQHGKPMTFPEWGLSIRPDGHGGGDAPYFVERMHEWIAANNVAYHLYFEYDADATYKLFGGSFPTAAVRFLELFGATAEPAPAPEPEPVPAPEPEPAPAPESSPEPTPKKQKKERRHPAKLQVARSSVVASTEQLDVLAPITKRASGTVGVVLHAAGRHESFEVDLEAGEGRLRFDRPIPNRQAQMGTGILTISYPGNGRSRPQEVRLRAASRQAKLDAERPYYEDGRVQSKGTVSSRARGVVRVQLEWVTAGEPHTVELVAKIRDGRWSLDETLAPDLQASIADREGTLHSYTLFTGYLPAKMRGEMQSYQVLGDR